MKTKCQIDAKASCMHPSNEEVKQIGTGYPTPQQAIMHQCNLSMARIPSGIRVVDGVYYVYRSAC